MILAAVEEFSQVDSSMSSTQGAIDQSLTLIGQQVPYLLKHKSKMMLSCLNFSYVSLGMLNLANACIFLLLEKT